MMDTAHLRELLTALEFFLPEVLRRDFSFWRHESLDAIFPVRSHAPSAGSVEIYGLALLVSDQSLTPMYAQVAGSSEGDDIAWVHCKLGERDPGGNRLIVPARYRADLVDQALQGLRERRPPIAWAFTIGRGAVPTAGQSLHIVSESCPVGCGFEVVLLRSITDASLFCYCSSCGCGWWSPANARFSAGLQSTEGIEAFAPGGVDVPTLEQIGRAGYGGEVISSISLDEWDEKIEALNARISEAG
ncbi:MAG TPA: hypothetical protein VJU61_14840 [Polyangiaceae bacterium]|nr:hypothetical protein [Polyangiaceae bacterium]